MQKLTRLYASALRAPRSAVTLASGLLCWLCLAPSAWAQSAPPGPASEVIGVLTTYGPVVSGMYLLYAVSAALIARYRASSWLAQGKRLAIATGLVGVLLAVLQSSLAGSSWTVILAAAVAAAFKLLTPTIVPNPLALATRSVQPSARPTSSWPTVAS